MKKVMLLCTVLFWSSSIWAQDTARVLVKVQNENAKAIAGEKIIFEPQNNRFKTENSTNMQGEMEVKLLGGYTYDIKIKTIGEAQEYNTLKIPSLKSGQQYGKNELIITIFEAKSFTLDNVYFDSGKSSLKPESYKELEELYEYLSLKKTIKIEIAGHTDNVGDEQANKRLSADRATAVKEYLISRGVLSSRIMTAAYGESKPIASNETIAGRSKNRRIEVIVL